MASKTGILYPSVKLNRHQRFSCVGFIQRDEHFEETLLDVVFKLKAQAQIHTNTHSPWLLKWHQIVISSVLDYSWKDLALYFSPSKRRPTASSRDSRIKKIIETARNLISSEIAKHNQWEDALDQIVVKTRREDDGTKRELDYSDYCWILCDDNKFRL
jgi:hypothetical protein